MAILGNLTKQEAQSALKEGKKVAHMYFADYEYIEKVHGVDTFEDGVKVPHDWWNQEYLNEDWRIYES